MNKLLDDNHAEHIDDNFFKEGIPRSIVTLREKHRTSSVSESSDMSDKLFDKSVQQDERLFLSPDILEQLEQSETEDNILYECLEETNIEEEVPEKSQEFKKVKIESLSRLTKQRGTTLSLLPSKSSDQLPHSLVLKYDFIPIVKSEDMIMTLADDSYACSFHFDDMEMWSRIVDYHHKQEEASTEETTSASSDSVAVGIFRPLYYKKFAELKKKLTVTKIKNTLIHRRLALYFKRKNMDYVLQEGENPLKDEEKYTKSIQEFADTLTYDTDQRRVINAQLAYLEEAKVLKSKKIKELFNDLQQREKNIGTGLIFSKTATELQDKVIQHLLNRQQAVNQELSEIRLKYIKLKIMVSDKEEEIENLNHIDEDHHLSHFEKLKAEQMLYLDKIEEKDEELTKLRARNNDTLQTLAHLREKISAFDDDNSYIDQMSAKFNFRARALRMYVNSTKKERDTYRSMYSKLKQESGLLQHPKLLDDMLFSMAEAKKLKENLLFLKQDYFTTTQKIRCIRKKMEETVDTPNKKQKSTVISNRNKLKTRTFLPKEKPSSFHTISPLGAFDHLVQEFQPTVKRIKSNKR